MGANQPSIMVLGGQHRNALEIVRHLGQLGIPVFVGGDSRFARANYSRYAQRRFVYPSFGSIGRSSRTRLEAAHDVVLRRVRDWRPDVLLPTMDENWRLVYDEYAALTRVVPCPGGDVFEEMLNKKTMTKRAERCGVSTPWTLCPESAEAALNVHDQIPYPVLLKPLQSTAGEGIRRMERAADLSSALRYYTTRPMMQEVVSGDDLELTLLCLHGTPTAGSAYLSLRNAPLPFGPPVACRTIRDDQLMDAGIRLLRDLGYHGVAHLDFRRDRRDGEPKLLDFNARLAGTGEISWESGVPFSYLLYQLALGEKPETCLNGKTGLEFRWLIFGELRHLMQSDRKLAVVRDLLKWTDVSTNWSLRDPLPHLAHLLSLGKKN